MLKHFGRSVRFAGILSLSLFAAGWTQPARAQVKLEQKFVEGAKTVNHTNMKVTQTLSLAGMNLETSSDRFVIVSSIAGKRETDGKIRVDQNVDKLSITVKLPGGLMLTFDSDDPNKKAENPALQPLVDAMGALSKAKIVFIYDQTGKVVAVEGLDKAAEKVSEEARGDLDPEVAKKNANQEVDRLPSDPVKVGDTWSRNADLNLGSGQIMSMTTEYKYVGEVKDGDKTYDKIEAKTTTTTFSIAEGSKLPLRVTKSDLKPTESSNTLLFDRSAGQFQSNKGKLRIQGDLEFSINGQTLPAKLDLTLESDTSRQP